MVIDVLVLGANDIKKHRWFNSFSWEDLLKQKIKPTYIPNVKNMGDVSNFEEYPDSNSQVQEIKAAVDPFLCW
jgi:protein kinase A